MKDALKLKTLDSRIYFIFTLLILIMILAMQIVSYYSVFSAIRESSIETNRRLLDRLVHQLDYYIDDMELIIDNVKSEPAVNWILELQKGVEDRDLRRSIEEKLHTFNKARQDISSIALFGFNGQIILDSGIDSLNTYARYKDSPWYKGAVALNGKSFVSSSYVQNLVSGKFSWVVSLSREIRDKGIMLIDLKFNRIQELCDSLTPGKKGYIFIVDEKGKYIYHPSQQLVYSGIKREPIQSILYSDSLSEDGKIYLSVTSVKTGWRICSVSFDDELMNNWRRIQYYYVIIGMLAFVIVGFATTFISQSITRPIHHLSDAMRSIETGEFRPIGKIEGTSEIQNLAREYDIMTGKINELMTAIVAEQEGKRKSDLKALQAQINPHFLYNTLDSIIWMGELNRNEEVIRMTSALSELFRTSISRGREIISIREEIHHVTSYLTIQEMRYKNKFTYSIQIDEDILECRILKITLQPLVENAIYHGIKSVNYEGLIEISGKRDGDRIILIVSDNGKGMNRDELESILSKDDSSTRQGMGVRNVHDRIQLYFGDDYGLKFNSAEGLGTEISATIPLIRGDEKS